MKTEEKIDKIVDIILSTQPEEWKKSYKTNGRDFCYSMVYKTQTFEIYKTVSPSELAKGITKILYDICVNNVLIKEDFFDEKLFEFYCKIEEIISLRQKNIMKMRLKEFTQQ